MMRTTLTLDPDVAKAINNFKKSRNIRLKIAINLILREGIKALVMKSVEKKKFKVKPFALGLLPGIDPLKLNQVSQELESKKIEK